jgi:phosphoglycerol transferase MdoB-like AlkP superfamily enzyme
VALDRHVTTVFRTCGAQFSVLCGLYDPPGFHVSREYPRVSLRCLPALLRDAGYDTLWVAGSSAGFDNNGAWLQTSGFSRIVTFEDFPADAVRFSYGIHDEAMLDRLLDEIEGARRPFFAYGLTLSNHHPYEPPAGFLQRHPEAAAHTSAEQMYRYVDEQVERFMARAAERPWYRDTLFVIAGDHPHWGYAAPPSARLRRARELRYQTVALLFHPALAPRRIAGRTSHLDLAPTIAGLLGLSADAEFAGRDVLGAAPAPPWYAAQENERNGEYTLLGDDRALVRRVLGGACEALEDGAAEPRACAPDETRAAASFEDTFYRPVQWQVVEMAKRALR